jgi:hypothetical protein
VNRPDDEDQLIRAYLLGGLSPAERESVGRRLVEDADFFERVQAHENDLVDAAAGGELDPTDAASVSALLNAGLQQHRLAFARSLRRAARRRSRQVAVRRYAVAAGILLACAAAWLAWDDERLRTRRILPGPPPVQQSTVTVFPVFLPAGVTRGSGRARSVHIPRDTAIVELQMDFAQAGTQAYSVILRNAQGQTLALLRNQHANRGMVLAPVAADLLPAGNYEVEISLEAGGKTGPLEFYYFKTE